MNWYDIRITKFWHSIVIVMVMSFLFIFGLFSVTSIGITLILLGVYNAIAMLVVVRKGVVERRREE